MQRNKSITLTVTENCNLSCTYCYENHKSNRKMSYNTAVNILEEELNKNDGFEEATIDFFGGEPFLEFELIKKISEYLWNHSFKKKYILFASSNGTLIHGKIKQWLYENRDRFWVGLSADGNQYMQDINRSSSFDLIDFSFFRETWPEQGVKMTISRETIEHLSEGCIFLHKMGFIVNCNLAYGIDWNNQKLVDILTTELTKLINYYLENPNIRPCSMLNMEIRHIAYNVQYSKWCGAGTQMRVYSPEGKYYPCHYFQPLSMGEELSEKSHEIDFSKTAELMDKVCDGCVLLPICPTCYGANYASTGDVAKKDNAICKLTKTMALANSFFWYRKLTDYSNEYLGITDKQRKEITDAIVKIQGIFA